MAAHSRIRVTKTRSLDGTAVIDHMSLSYTYMQLLSSQTFSQCQHHNLFSSISILEHLLSIAVARRNLAYWIWGSVDEDNVGLCFF